MRTSAAMGSCVREGEKGDENGDGVVGEIVAVELRGAGEERVEAVSAVNLPGNAHTHWQLQRTTLL